MSAVALVETPAEKPARRGGRKKLNDYVITVRVPEKVRKKLAGYKRTHKHQTMAETIRYVLAEVVP